MTLDIPWGKFQLTDGLNIEIDIADQTSDIEVS